MKTYELTDDEIKLIEKSRKQALHDQGFRAGLYEAANLAESWLHEAGGPNYYHLAQAIKRIQST